MNKIAISSLLALLFAAIFVVQAQQPRHPEPAQMIQHRVDFLTQKLGLLPAQQQQATTIFTNAMNGQQSLHNDMHTAHQALQTAITNNDQNGITQAATTIGNLTAQSIARHSKAEAAFLQILNPQQQSTYNQMMQEHGGHGFGRGGFGPGGPHPF